MVKVEKEKFIESELSCPECGSKELGKYGSKWAKIGVKRVKVAQFQCKKCGRVTVNPKENESD